MCEDASPSQVVRNLPEVVTSVESPYAHLQQRKRKFGAVMVESEQVEVSRSENSAGFVSMINVAGPRRTSQCGGVRRGVDDEGPEGSRNWSRLLIKVRARLLEGVREGVGLP
jgi:hypothetical protein